MTDERDGLVEAIWNVRQEMRGCEPLHMLSHRQSEKVAASVRAFLLTQMPPRAKVSPHYIVRKAGWNSYREQALKVLGLDEGKEGV